jgi:hypothetical protein
LAGNLQDTDVSLELGALALRRVAQSSNQREGIKSIPRELTILIAFVHVSDHPLVRREIDLAIGEGLLCSPETLSRTTSVALALAGRGRTHEASALAATIFVATASPRGNRRRRALCVLPRQKPNEDSQSCPIDALQSGHAATATEAWVFHHELRVAGLATNATSPTT